uniref:Uncharacterized protein n=1 Tax=Arundo donax TaxID=35708 RepID=A0A0A9DU80_ARUDO
MYQQLDNEMYGGCKDKRWRHYIPPDWAVLALGIKASWLTNEVKVMFVGYHVTYKVSECRLVLVPIKHELTWCLYAWDFERGLVTFLDPLGSKQLGPVAEKYKCTVARLHEAMIARSEKLFKNRKSENK